MQLDVDKRKQGVEFCLVLACQFQPQDRVVSIPSRTRPAMQPGAYDSAFGVASDIRIADVGRETVQDTWSGFVMYRKLESRCGSHRASHRTGTRPFLLARELQGVPRSWDGYLLLPFDPVETAYQGEGGL